MPLPTPIIRGHGDANCLARHLLLHPATERETVALRVCSEAQAAGLSLMDKALRLGCAPEPFVLDPEYLDCLLVAYHLFDDMAQVQRRAAA